MDDVMLRALLDGECSASELDDALRRFDREPGLRAQLARMIVARDARRHVRINPANLNLANRVRAALPDRPDPVAGVVNPFSRAIPAQRRVPWRPMVALAAAAAFGAVAVLVLKPQPAIDAPAPVAEVASAPTAATDFVPASLDEQDRQQVMRYLISHSEARAGGMGGTLGYARYAAYADETPVQASP